MNRIRLLTLMLAAFVTLSGCVPQRNMVYFQGQLPELPPSSAFQLRIGTGDLLSVNVFTTNTEAYPYFSPPGDRNFGDSRSAYEKGIVVSDSGTIELPLIGIVHLEGMTLSEASQRIRQQYSSLFNDPVVTVKKLDFRITVLGEVNRPGLYTIADERVTLPELLGMAGDITQFGDRTCIRIIRSEKGKTADFTVNLTDASSLTAAAYYLHPDDILYVTPVRRRALQNASNPILLFTSILTTAAVLITAMVAVNK